MGCLKGPRKGFLGHCGLPRTRGLNLGKNLSGQSDILLATRSPLAPSFAARRAHRVVSRAFLYVWGHTIRAHPGLNPQCA